MADSQNGREAAAREAAKEHEDLYNRVPCGYRSLGPEGVFLRINDTELGWLGYRREEIVGKKRLTDFLTPASRQVFEALYPVFKQSGPVNELELELVRRDGTVLPEAEFFEQAVRHVVQTGMAVEFEHRVLTSDGGASWGLIHVAPELDEAGKVAYVQLVTRDITERKRAEENLRLAASVFANSYGGVTYDWPRFFVRLAYDPKTNFTPVDARRLSIGTRF
jgi:PAS domain S-box-containing protein